MEDYKFPRITENFEQNIKNGWCHDAAYVLRDSGDVEEAKRIQIFKMGTPTQIKAWVDREQRAFQLVQRAVQKAEINNYCEQLKREAAERNRRIIADLMAEAKAASASVRLGRGDRARRTPIYADSRRLTPPHDAIL